MRHCDIAAQDPRTIKLKAKVYGLGACCLPLTCGSCQIQLKRIASGRLLFISTSPGRTLTENRLIAWQGETARKAGLSRVVPFLSSPDFSHQPPNARCPS